MSLIEACKEDFNKMKIALRSKIDTVRDIVNNDADLNETDDLGQTGLIWAVRKGHNTIVELLCDSSADVNVASHTGNALEIAEKGGHDDLSYGGRMGGTRDAWNNAGDDDDGPGMMDEEDSYVAKIQIYYNAEDKRKEDQKEALELYRQCVSAYEEWKSKFDSGEITEEVDDDTVTLAMKALVAETGILLHMGKDKDALSVYDRVFSFANDAAISESDFRSAVLGVLTAAADQRKRGVEAVISVFDKALRKLEELGNQSLMDETSFRLCTLYSQEGDLKNAEQVLERVHKKCQINGEDDLSKPDQLSEIYARLAQIRFESKSEDDSFLQHVYRKTCMLTTNVMDPKNDSIIKECWGKKFGNEGHWEAAFGHFLTAFKNYQTIGNNDSARRSLQYTVMANMLCDTTENPFDQQEARAFDNDLDIKAIKDLRNAYEKCDVARFKAALEAIRPDWYVSKHLHAVVRDFHERAICDLIIPYQRVRVEFLSTSLGESKEGVMDILIQLILDGRINGRINEVEGILDLRQGRNTLSQLEKAKYRALSTWAYSIESARKSMPQPEGRRSGLGAMRDQEFSDIQMGGGAAYDMMNVGSSSSRHTGGAGPGRTLF
eukprot:jgi/Bigna1/75646/fgenesh1_pg.36_\